MSGEGPCFVDTNILVYALAGDDAERSLPAQRLLRELMTTGRLRTSTQVLQELFVTVTRKVSRPLDRSTALRYLDHLSAWPVIVADYGAIRESIELMDNTSISFWDALVVTAARRSGAQILYTEDLQHGQLVDGVRIENPFRAS